MEHIQINNIVEKLVMGRFTLDELNTRLNKDFQCSVEVFEKEREESDEIPENDDLLIFSLEEYEVDVDLFYIKDNGGNYYITETCVNPF